MSIQKILPVARKMGEENYAAYKAFKKSSKQMDGKIYSATLNLTGVSLMDTVDITLKDKKKLPTGFMDLAKAVYKKYFPRAASEDARKTVILSRQNFEKDHVNRSIVTVTEDKDGVFAHGFLHFERNKNNITANVESNCEDVLFRLSTIIDLPEKNSKGKHNVDLNLSSAKDILFEEKDGRTKISLTTPPTKEVPFLGIQIEAPNKMLESIFSDDIENSIAEAMVEAGIKI
ncbi:MAG: hypothetical protein E7Z89_07415 [Cyanobacteria bacterium SIG28]|nr:hypothetical protein [Cyanobacteria bacterium SIG28]